MTRRVILIFVFTFTLVVLVGVSALALQRYMAGGTAGTRSTGGTETAAGQADAGEIAQKTAEFAEPIPERAEVPETPAQDGVGQAEEQEDPAADADAQTAEEEVREDPFTRRVTPAEADAVTMAFAGDILFDSSYSIQARVPKDGSVTGQIGASLLEEMNRVDLMVVNNEFPYTSRGTPQPEKIFTFHAHPRTVRQLKEMGVDLVSLANNHTFDYGEQGFLDTLDTLDRAGIPRIGAGRDIEEASHPMTFVSNGMRIAVIAATQIERFGNPNTRGATESLPGVFRCMDDKRLCERVREAKADHDFVIVFIHWGTENTEQPDWLQLQQAPEIAAAGADLIIGAHSHCLQPISIVSGVPVVYSLGNFLFNSKTLDTGLVECVIERADTGSAARLRSLTFLPCIQSGCAVRFAEGEEKGRILQYMRDISPGTAIDADGGIDLAG